MIVEYVKHAEPNRVDKPPEKMNATYSTNIIQTRG
jgi:hypothetical protein